MMKCRLKAKRLKSSFAFSFDRPRPVSRELITQHLSSNTFALERNDSSMKNGMGRLVFLGSLGISLLAGRAAAQATVILESQRDALYAQGLWLSASLDGSLPTVPVLKTLPVATKDPWK